MLGVTLLREFCFWFAIDYPSYEGHSIQKFTFPFVVDIALAAKDYLLQAAGYHLGCIVYEGKRPMSLAALH